MITNFEIVFESADAMKKKVLHNSISKRKARAWKGVDLERAVDLKGNVGVLIVILKVYFHVVVEDIS